MPGTVVATDELLEIAIAPDVKVARHWRALEALEVGMLAPVQLVGKQALHMITPIVTRGQADAMQHDEINFRPTGARTKIGRDQPTRKLVPAIQPEQRRVQKFRRGHQTIRCCSGCQY